MGQAADLYAELTRNQWSDYVKNIIPYEDKLIEYANDPSVVTNAMSTASQNVAGSFDRQAAANTERLQGLGLSLNQGEQKAATRSLGLARSLADVQAQNSARDQTVARQQSILGNPAPNIGALPQ